MATYYVDLSLGTNGHTGTDVDPFSGTGLVVDLTTVAYSQT